RATPETLRERIGWRGRGGGPQIPGDQELHGASAERLMAVWEASGAAMERLGGHRIGGICIDKDGGSGGGGAGAGLAQAPGWSRLRGPTAERQAGLGGLGSEDETT